MFALKRKLSNKIAQFDLSNSQIRKRLSEVWNIVGLERKIEQQNSQSVVLNSQIRNGKSQKVSQKV